jgi:hypothetical protein
VHLDACRRSRRRCCCCFKAVSLSSLVGFLEELLRLEACTFAKLEEEEEEED